MRKLAVIIIALLCIKNSRAQNGSELVKATDLLHIRTSGHIKLSKDGTKVAFTVNSIDTAGTSKWDYKYVSQVYLAATDAISTPQQITFSKEGATQPAWSPDGSKLAFVRNIESKPQLFLLTMQGGEAIQITNAKYGAANPKWSPDGQKILFSTSISFEEILKDSLLNPGGSIPLWSLEKPGFEKNEQLRKTNAKANPDGSLAEIRAYLENNEADKKAVVLNKLNFQDELNVSAKQNLTQYFIIEAKQNARPVLITKGFHDFNNAEFTPDGKHLILSGDVDSVESPDRSLENQIFIAESDGSNFRMLLGEKDKTYNTAKPSPSGKWLAFLKGSTSFVSIPALSIMPLKGSAKDIITIPFDRTITDINWGSDERYLYFIAQSNGGTPLYRVDLNSKKVEQLSDVNSGIASFDVSKNKIVFVKVEVNDPSEVYIADAGLKNERRISNFNSWITSKKLSLPEKRSFVNDQGMTVEYWIMKPTNYEAGKKYPLLLEIHGGPSAMWGPGEPTMWHEFQYFCSRGYGVVYCNPRGSGGYGEKFLKANIMDWGKGPSTDVLTALDKAVADGWADTSRLLTTGGSYAGYLVAWIISHDKRFKAACSQRGVYDLATFFGEGNAWRLVPNYFGGYPWEPKTKEILVRESPISYVHNITTPYIIFHGENDRRTGVIQSEMMYRSLKVLNRPVEYVRHPGASHEITRSGDNRQRIDQMLRTYEFFERWINKK